MPTYEKPEDAGNALQVLLLKAVPENAYGNKTLNHLAKLMHLSKWAIRKWINNEKIPPERAKQVVEISRIVGYDDKKKPILGDPRVSLDDFHEFVYKD